MKPSHPATASLRQRRHWARATVAAAVTVALVLVVALAWAARGAVPAVPG